MSAEFRSRNQAGVTEAPTEFVPTSDSPYPPFVQAVLKGALTGDRNPADIHLKTTLSDPSADDGVRAKIAHDLRISTPAGDVTSDIELAVEAEVLFLGTSQADRDKASRRVGGRSFMGLLHSAERAVGEREKLPAKKTQASEVSESEANRERRLFEQWKKRLDGQEAEAASIGEQVHAARIARSRKPA